ncbi:MAG: DUF1674 domain-containing protein [Woeseiaceae bacterium]
MSTPDPDDKAQQSESAPGKDSENNNATEERLREIGGRQGPDPTRYGDWEKGGRCIDF